MFRNYKDMSDVVSVMVCCPNDKTYLCVKEPGGELWLPSGKCDKNSWKLTANKMVFELFGLDNLQCSPMRVNKIWLPQHPRQWVYHAIFKVSIKSEIKKRLKIKPQTGPGRNQGLRKSMAWYNMSDLDRQKAHYNLRSPEIIVFAIMAMGDPTKPDHENPDVENGGLVEISEETIIVGPNGTGGGAVAMASHNLQLVQAANYTKHDQIRMYREFILMVYPALFMSFTIFTQFMVDIGWQRSLCPNLYRAADVNGRGGISFLELLLWSAVQEPGLQHTGIAADMRCRYIFRYFDANRDSKLDIEEFKELIAAARYSRQMAVDSLSVARDAEVCFRQLGLQTNSLLPLSEYLRSIGELRIKGISSLLRSPRSISEYLVDLRDNNSEAVQPSSSLTKISKQGLGQQITDEACASRRGSAVRAPPPPDYALAAYTVRMHRAAPLEMIELCCFDEDAITMSSTRLVAMAKPSFDVLSPSSLPVEALASVHYFATPIEARNYRRPSMAQVMAKPSNTWGTQAEEVHFGNMLLRLAEAVAPICEKEPRLLRIKSPVYVIGDLHGNLNALLSMETNLWATGTNLVAAKLLFLGDFVDRGAHGSELICYLLAAKYQRPNSVLMVRGNHETRDIQKMFTFYNECISKYGELEGNKIWNAVNNVFDALPLAAVVDDKIFCCHGGIPPPWVCPLVSAIDKIPVPLPRPSEESTLAWELLWNDPIRPSKITATLQLELAGNEGFAANYRRGTGHLFDQNALDRFLTANQFSHVLRAHELHQNGFMCQLKGRLVTVFSSYQYCGGNNDSGVVLLGDGKLRLIRINND